MKQWKGNAERGGIATKSTDTTERGQPHATHPTLALPSRLLTPPSSGGTPPTQCLFGLALPSPTHLLTTPAILKCLGCTTGALLNPFFSLHICFVVVDDPEPEVPDDGDEGEDVDVGQEE
ncbi:hypothetical protein NMY22_g17331 [Coprinellus aureogranulatus]|nr:hypothetical protein NMY22_g17331 [Coprinellus aureogranulatus]